MRRRLTLAMTLMVVAALVLAGVVTLLVSVRTTREATRHDLRNEARGLALAVRSDAQARTRRNPAVSLRAILVELKAPLRLAGIAVVAVRPDGTVYDPLRPRQPLTLPAPLSAADIHPDQLLAGSEVSGERGAVVYAAYPFRAALPAAGATTTTATQAVILTRRPPTGLRPAWPWFLLSALLIVGLSLLVADRLGRRFVRPLRAAQVVTGHIAEGDLTARVPEPPGTDPELAALSASINTMAEKLARARGGERQFLLSVSHELRTPLTSIRGFAEAIEDGAATDTRRAAAVIASESRRLERLVGDLLDLAKLEARRFSLDLQPVDLGGSVAAAAAGFEPTAADLGLDLVVDTPDDDLGALADVDRLAQVVANLIENALRYARTGVRVAAASSGGVPVLWVSDDGPGITSDDLASVFGRLAATRPAGRNVGSGLGLAIVSELVTAMGGHVRAESPTGPAGGTRIVVTLAPVPAPVG